MNKKIKVAVDTSMNISEEEMDRFKQEMEIDDDGLFFVDECKFYGEKNFIKYLTDKVTEGDLLFTGEDGFQYGYRFDGKGKYRKLSLHWK